MGRYLLPGTAGLHSQGPAQGSLLWPLLQAGSVLPSLLPASLWEPHPLMEKMLQSPATLPCPASCHPWQDHGVSVPCSQLGLLQELQGLSWPKL